MSAIRLTHVLALVIWGVLLFTAIYLRVPDLFEAWLRALFSIVPYVSLGCGIALVYVHRRDASFLPLPLYVTYVLATAATGFAAMVLLHDVVRVQAWLPRLTQWDNFAYVAVPLVALLAFAVPWLLWRRDKLTPVVLDAGLLALVAIMANDALHYLRYGDVRREPWYIWFVDGEHMATWGVLALLALPLLLVGRR